MSLEAAVSARSALRTAKRRALRCADKAAILGELDALIADAEHDVTVMIGEVARDVNDAAETNRS